MSRLEIASSMAALIICLTLVCYMLTQVVIAIGDFLFSQRVRRAEQIEAETHLAICRHIAEEASKLTPEQLGQGAEASGRG